MIAILVKWWQVFRELVGDDAYERYCEHHGHQHQHEPLLDRRTYYLKTQQEKWNGIKRCC
jgi:uncharacterized short protein YbdD (DUF466 family)